MATMFEEEWNVRSDEPTKGEVGPELQEAHILDNAVEPAIQNSR